MPHSPASNSAAPAPRLIFIYAAIVVGGLAIALDFASVDLALPALERDFGLDLDSVQWVINGYVLAFSVFMVVGGRLADTYGRKLIFLLGLGVFTVASLLGGAAWNGDVLIACRVLQGVGAAMLWPAMIGMGCGAVGDAKRPMVLGLLFATCAVGNAAGPVVGGALTEWFSWRWVLWVNVPMALFAIAVTAPTVPTDHPSRGTAVRNDYLGMTVLTGGLVALMLLAYQAAGPDWMSARTVGFAVAAAALLGAFPFLERRAPEPLIPLELMRNKEIATLCFSVLAICQLFFIVLLYFTQYGMKFLGEGPVAAGSRVVQFMISYGITSYFGGPLMKLVGSRRLLVIGLIMSAAASVLLGFCGPGGSWLPFNLGLVALGLGVGAVIPTVNCRAIGTVGTDRASLVSGVVFMCQLAGSALMLAVNTAIFTAVAMAHLGRGAAAAGVTLSADQQQAVSAILTGARTVHLIPPATVGDAAEIAALVTAAYTSGMQVVMWLGAGMLVVALLLVLRFVPNRAEEAAG
jgi:MFS family permease